MTHPSPRLDRKGVPLLRLLTFAFVLALVVLAFARGARVGAVRAVRAHASGVMNTDVGLTVVARDAEAAGRAARRAVDRLRRLEGQLSAHLPDSDITRCNRAAGRRSVKVAPVTLRVLAEAVRFGDVTHGAFDVTVGPLIGLWRACVREKRLPTDGELRAARDKVGYQGLRLNMKARTVRFAKPGMRVDLGGVAKGLAVDRAFRSLAEDGFPNALVEVGGDLYAGGRRADGRPWRVGVQDPRVSKDGPAESVAVLAVKDRGVATSGNYRRYSMIRARRVNHILDPRTGRPADVVDSVTVIAPDCATADALATGVSVLGVEAGLQLVNSLPDVEAFLITVEDGRLREHRSRGLSKYEVPVEPSGVQR